MDHDKKYISLTRLGEYDTKLKQLIDQKDATNLSSAKSYAVSLAPNYDAAGTAQTKVNALANGQVKTNQTDIANLKTGKADKATTLAGYGITDAFTKTQTTTEINKAVANAGHLKRTIVTQLPAVDAADQHTIYMIAKTSGSGDNQYDEYILVVTGATGSQTKKFEKIGDTAVDLTNYATKSYVDSAKSSAISTAATDATSKANKALADAKAYANGLGSKYATAAQGAKADTALQDADIASGTANGAISVKGTNVQVNGLGSAAYTASTAYEKAGAVAALQNGQVATNKNDIATLKGQVGTLQGQVLTECTTAEIDALFD